MGATKKERVRESLLRRETEYFPTFVSLGPQYLSAVANKPMPVLRPVDNWQYCVALDLDVVQVGHGVFYPIRLGELPVGATYQDELGRTHQITEHYDDFIAPYPLRHGSGVSPKEIRAAWEAFEFPDPAADHYFTGIDEVVERNNALDDPLAVWGVINGPFEPSWQLLSDGWPEYYILARKDPDLARAIIGGVTDFCIRAGQALIRHGADVIRIGDDYALNEGLMCARGTWEAFVFPAHARLVTGLKAAGGDDFPVILHSDGDITGIFDLLCQGGIDALNPIQPDALELEEVLPVVSHRLAATGAFDLRLLLPQFSSGVGAVEAEVDRLFEIVRAHNRGSTHPTGFCFGPSHQIQPGSSPALVKAAFERAQQLNGKRG
jgi:uroporphyrinogen decarboxylase